MTSAHTPRMPQLDGLRAFAVSAVLLHHLWVPLPQFLGPVPWGLAGVRLFFVLSGFLITGLLLCATQAQPGRAEAGAVVKQFYIRRALRIFPIYYLVLAAGLALRPPDVPEQLPWLATYTYNFWISYLGWYPGFFAHFWSLCVEEQFYLLWPWLLVFATRRAVWIAALLMVLVSPLFRWTVLAYEFNAVAYYTLTPSHVDALGLGALLALCTRGQPASSTLELRLRSIALPVAIIGVSASYFSRQLSDLFFDTFVALAFVWLVAAASRGFRGIAGRALEASPVLFLGKISYGVYVYHLVIRDFWKIDLGGLGLAGVWKDLLTFAVYCVIVIAVATLSWLVVERPINRLKERWSGRSRPPLAQHEPSA